MTTRTQRTIRPAARMIGISGYRTPVFKQPIDLWLDANEGMPPTDVAVSITPEMLRRYPDATALEARLAQRVGVGAECVVVTCGGDDAIDRVCRVVLEPGRNLLTHTPTFEMIGRSARLAGGRVDEITWSGGPFPTERFIDAIGPETALVAVVSPNNPTGGVLSREDLVSVVSTGERRGVIVLVDLAYVEFADEDPTRGLLDFPNIVVVRTFSKAFGLAGLRVGYAISSPLIAGWIRAAGGPYPVSATAMSTADASLDRDLAGTIKCVRDGRLAVECVLGEACLDAHPSQANFVAARTAKSGWIRDGLASLGVAVRTFADRPGCESLVRITIPCDQDEQARLTTSLRTVLKPEALLFDLDGVLADVSGSYREAIIRTARSFGVDIGPDDISAAKADGNANNDWELTRRLIGLQTKTPPLDEVVARFQDIYLGPLSSGGLRERESLIPSADWLSGLAQQIPLAVVTGRPRDEAEWFLERAGIRNLFVSVVCMEDSDAKPSPVPVRRALERVGVSRAWMVGDTPDDMVSARAAGVVAIGVTAPGENTKTMLIRAGAARVLNSLDQIKELLP